MDIGIFLCKALSKSIDAYDNINLYLILNNIDLHVNDSNLPVNDYARENIKFFNSQNEEIETSWNHLYKMVQDGRDSSSIKQQIFLSKDEASKIIYSKQKQLNRPLLQSDFENVLVSKDSVSMRVIYRIWGTFNNMIEDLGLEKHDTYFKPNSKNYLSHNEIMNMINKGFFLSKGVPIEYRSTAHRRRFRIQTKSLWFRYWHCCFRQRYLSSSGFYEAWQPYYGIS